MYTNIYGCGVLMCMYRFFQLFLYFLLFFFCQICLRLDMYVWSTGKILSYLVVHPSIHRSTRRTLESFCSESGSFSCSCYIRSFILTCNRQTIELEYRNQVRGWWYGLGNFFLGNVSLHWIPSMYVSHTYSFFSNKMSTEYSNHSHQNGLLQSSESVTTLHISVSAYRIFC